MRKGEQQSYKDLRVYMCVRFAIQISAHTLTRTVLAALCLKHTHIYTHGLLTQYCIRFEIISVFAHISKNLLSSKKCTQLYSQIGFILMEISI